MSRDTMTEIALSAENDLLREAVNAANKFTEALTSKTLLLPPPAIAALNQMILALNRWNDWNRKGEAHE